MDLTATEGIKMLRKAEGIDVAKYLSEVNWALAYVNKVNYDVAAQIEFGTGAYVCGIKEMTEARDKLNALLVQFDS